MKKKVVIEYENKATEKTKEAPKDLPKKQGWRTVWSILWLLVWVGVAIIASQFIVGWLMILLIGTEEFAKPVPTAIFSALSYVLAMVLIIKVPSRSAISWRVKAGKKIRSGVSAPKEANREVLGLKGLPTWTDIGLALVGFFVYLLLAAGLMAIFSQFAWFDAGETQNVGFSTYIAGFDRLVAFLTLVVVAPVAEEIIFRGWLYGKIRSRLWGKMADWAAILITTVLVSLLFGVVHGQWNVGVNVFALSVVLCALREITGGSIYAGILLHMLKNGVAFYLLYVIGV